MAASWLLQAIYTSLLSSVADLGGSTGGSGPDSTIAPSPLDPGQATILAQTTAGIVRGRVDNSSQPTIFRYLGVPFAKPPLGDLRFAAPVRPKPWSGVKDAFNISAQCWQPYYAAMETSIEKSEDCLYLNIYTPARDSSAGLLPVMVFVHGGGYFLGTGATYNGTELARQGGVLVVTFNYRIGVFGFLSTEDATMPGNYGILDQIHALKWVRDNIANFGGDPNSVTIFGQSAGSSSVSLLVLSPLAKGLFHRAIMESGVSLALWAHVYPTQRLSPVYGARMVGAANGCSHVFGQSDSFVNCLRRVNASALIDTAYDLFILIDSLWLQPRVETIFGVLPKAPQVLLERGEFNDVDTIRGFTSHENGKVKIRNKTVTVTTKELFVELIRDSLKSHAIPEIEVLLNQFSELYIGNNSDPTFINLKASEASSDLMFASPVLTELKLATSKPLNTKHYLYSYNYRDSFSTMPSWVGAIHGDELKHIFGMDQLDFAFLGLDKVTKTPEDVAMTQKMMNLWSNFAKTGDPTPDKNGVSWRLVTSTRQWVNNIDTFGSVSEFTRTHSVDLFERILQIFNGRPLGLSSENIIG